MPRVWHNHGTSRSGIAFRSRLLAAGFSLLLFAGLFTFIHWGLSPLPRATLMLDDDVSRFEFSPDFHTLVTFSSHLSDKRVPTDPIQVWDLCTGQLRYTAGRPGFPVDTVLFSPDSRLLAIHQLVKDVLILDAQTGATVARYPPKIEAVSIGFPRSPILGFTPDSRALLSEAPVTIGRVTKVYVRLWSLDRRAEIGRVEGCWGGLRPAPHGYDVATYTYKDQKVDRVLLWQLSEPEPPLLIKEIPVAADRIAFRPDLAMFATYNASSGVPARPAEIALWDTISGTRRCSFPYDDAGTHVHSFSFSGDGRVLVARGDERPMAISIKGSIRTTIWDITSPAPAVITSSLDRVQVSPDGQWLACARVNGPVLFQIGTALERQLPLGRMEAFLLKGPFNEDYSEDYSALRFSPDSRMLALGDICVGREPIPMNWLPNSLRKLFHRSDDWLIRFWDTSTGTEQASIFHAHTPHFSPDGQTLVTRDEGDTVRLWDLPLRRPLARDLWLSLLVWLGINVLAGVVVRAKARWGLRLRRCPSPSTAIHPNAGPC